MRMASEVKTWQVVLLVINSGVDPRLCGEYAQSLVLMAAEDGAWHVVDLVLKYASDHRLVPPVHMAGEKKSRYLQVPKNFVTWKSRNCAQTYIG